MICWYRSVAVSHAYVPRDMHAPDALLRVRCWFSRVLARGVHASHALYMLLTRCTCISRVDSASDAYLKCTSRVLFLFLVIVGLKD